MKMKRVIALAAAAVLAIGSMAGCSSSSKSYPSKNVNVIVPFGAGGNTDMSIRALLNTATEQVDDNYTFVVENKTGNGGLVGMEALAGSDADGYTLGATCIDLMLHICFGRTETTMDDYIPIAATMADPYALVVSSSSPNYSTLEEFVDYAKANPGAIKVGDSGAGAAPNIAAKAFEMYFGVTFDIYTYDGSADCITAIESGEIDATFTQPSPAVASLKAGTLSMLGVLSDERLSGFPDCPTIMETFGDDYNLVMKGWVALTAPAGTPDDVVDTLTDLMGQALQTDEYKEQIESLGMEYMVLYGDELTSFLEDQMAFYEEVCATIEL
jgi:tripartite-type tricarboxylate transporter receptor subunit TctC